MEVKDRLPLGSEPTECTFPKEFYDVKSRRFGRQQMARLLRGYVYQLLDFFLSWIVDRGFFGRKDGIHRQVTAVSGLGCFLVLSSTESKQLPASK